MLSYERDFNIVDSLDHIVAWSDCQVYQATRQDVLGSQNCSRFQDGDSLGQFIVFVDRYLKIV